jgi:hypothetical protein
MPSTVSRRAAAALALAHGYDTAFWWVTGIFAGGAVVGGVLLRRGPLGQESRPADHRNPVMTGRLPGREAEQA